MANYRHSVESTYALKKKSQTWIFMINGFLTIGMEQIDSPAFCCFTSLHDAMLIHPVCCSGSVTFRWFVSFPSRSLDSGVTTACWASQLFKNKVSIHHRFFLKLSICEIYTVDFLPEKNWMEKALEELSVVTFPVLCITVRWTGPMHTGNFQYEIWVFDCILHTTCYFWPNQHCE